MSTLLKTELPNLLHRGKVRDIYDLGDTLLIVATDRLSAFDVVLPTGIPTKGIVLNELSAFWFRETASIVPNHFVALGRERAKLQGAARDLPEDIARRAMLVKKAKPVLVECVVRGYISGSAWAEYKNHGTVGGMSMPSDLRESEKLPSIMFTPTTKASKGHDENISMTQVEEMVGKKTAKTLKDTSLAIYEFAHDSAFAKGIVIADTKFEFGFIGEKLILIDEVLTPDSSRFWSVKDYKVGRAQDSFDKQIVRDWLLHSGWSKEPPAPALPQDVVDKTATRYQEVFERLTGTTLNAA